MKAILIYFLVCSIAGFAQSSTTVFDVARSGTVKEIKALYKTNPKSIVEVNKEGFSPLILAAYKGNTEVVEFLINNGADCNGNSKMGTPLMAAVVKGNTKIVQLLLNKKVNLNATDGNGTTALIYATMFRYYDIIKALVKAGADVELKDNRKNGAVDYAILANDDKMMELLKIKTNKN